MFCKFCGNKIDDLSVFCSHCGKKINAVDTILNQNTSVSALVDMKNADERKGMSIYFNDICRLEFISYSLMGKAENLKQRMEMDKEIRYVFWDYGFNHNNRFYGNGVRFIYGYDGIDFYFYVQSKMLDSRGHEDEPTFLWEEYYPETNFKEEHKLTPERMKKLTEPIYREEKRLFGYKMVLDDRWNCDSYEFHGINAYFVAAWRKTFEEGLEIAKNTLVQNYNDAQADLKNCGADLEKVEDELNQAKDLLTKEYSLNIIPNKFRNLEAMWYICDYYDSSEESLKEILLHLDLDAIKSKLDEVIFNQQQIIINQAIEIAQNKTLIAQNQEILCNLASIEKETDQIAQNSEQIAQNTAKTSQWAQIAANNAEACAWIGVANYIR